MSDDGTPGFIASLSILRRAFKRGSHCWSIQMRSTTLDNNEVDPLDEFQKPAKGSTDCANDFLCYLIGP